MRTGTWVKKNRILRGAHNYISCLAKDSDKKLIKEINDAVYCYSNGPITMDPPDKKSSAGDYLKAN